MGNGFLILGGVLLIFSLLVALVIAARSWPAFAPDEPDQRARFARYLQTLPAEWRQRPAWKSVRYPSLTGVVWLLAGLVLNSLPAGVSDRPIVTSLLIPLLTYGPVVFLFFYDQVRKKRA